MFETDKIVAAIFAAALVNKRNVARTDEYLVYYDNFLTETAQAQRKGARAGRRADGRPPRHPHSSRVGAPAAA